MESAKVRPSQPVQSHTFKLSLCDVYIPKIWVIQTHFWSLGTGLSFEEVFEILKESLSRSLTEIPAFLGHMGRGSDDPRDLVVNVGNDDFVDFAREDLSTKDDVPAYHDLLANGFALPTHLTAIFSQRITLKLVVEESPMFTAKLNLLKGGLALTFAFNHSLADAPAYNVFESLWARHTADVIDGVPAQRYRAFEADDDVRKQLSTPIDNAIPFESPHWKLFPTDQSLLKLLPGTANEEPVAGESLAGESLAGESVASEFVASELTDENILPSVVSSKKDVRWVIWHFDAASLARLKKDASDPSMGAWISTIDAVNGLFWARLPVVKQSGDKEISNSVAAFPMNMRKRLDKPLPTDFVGNAVRVLFADCPLVELEKGGLSGVRAAAACLRKNITGWNQSEYNSWLAMAASLPSDQAICPEVITGSGNRVIFNDYSRSPTHTLDWGTGLGRIDRTRYMWSAETVLDAPLAMYVNPVLIDGSLEVFVACDKDVRQALLQDQLLGSYASVINVV